MSSALCIAPGAICCTSGVGLLAWSVFDFIDPPRVIEVPESARSSPSLPAAPRVAREDVMAH